MQWLPGLINNLQWEPGQTHMKTHSSLKGERWEQHTLRSHSLSLLGKMEGTAPPPPLGVRSLDSVYSSASTPSPTSVAVIT